MRCVLILPLLFSVSTWAQSINEIDQETENEFQIKLEYHELRYEDFFARIKQKEAYKRERLADADLHKQKREQRKQERERIRREFVENRKQKESLEKYKPEYERLVELRQKRHQRSREIYIEKRNRLRRVKEQAKLIPGMLEMDLN